ncbi:MAG: glycosyltransferase, partial [Bacteroidales bacterium]|nr:glycosyltransferase [Bacteroidales bacterium]
REYYEKRPDLFHVIIEQERQYGKRGLLLPLCKQAQGKYIAFCDGDDYWIDSFKLQKQFDFMEAHAEYSMCGTKTKLIYQDRIKKRIRRRRKEKCGDVSLNQLMWRNPYVTSSTFLKSSLVQDWIEISSKINKKGWKMGDLPLFIFCTTKGNGYILQDITACYRVLSNSASHGNPKKMHVFRGGEVHIRLSLMKKLSIPYSSERILKSWVFLQIKDALVLKEFVPKRRLSFYWKFYWKGRVHPEPIRFVIMFGILRCFCWFNQKNTRSGDLN